MLVSHSDMRSALRKVCCLFLFFIAQPSVKLHSPTSEYDSFSPTHSPPNSESYASQGCQTASISSYAHNSAQYSPYQRGEFDAQGDDTQSETGTVQGRQTASQGRQTGTVDVKETLKSTLVTPEAINSETSDTVIKFADPNYCMPREVNSKGEEVVRCFFLCFSSGVG